MSIGGGRLSGCEFTWIERREMYRKRTSNLEKILAPILFNLQLRRVILDPREGLT